MHLKISMPRVCREVLLLRQQLAHSSVAKFDKMQQMCCDDGRVKGNLVYHGSHTGRFSGRGIQVQNLPRAKVNNPEQVITDFNTLNYDDLRTLYPDLNATASALIRPMIMAEKGKNLIVADYSSIENVVLHWAAGDEKTVQDFRNGLCQYKVYSAARLGIKYEEVTKEQRQNSKPDVLGLGYGGGYKALIKVAAGYGVTLEIGEGQERVKFYRNKYKKIPQLWRNVFNKVLETITTKDPQVLITPNIKLEFRCAGGYLFILLPSGRRLSYPKVKLNAVWSIKVRGHDVPMTAAISYMGVKNNTWMRIGTHPGMLVENIIQAMARDILVYGLLCAEQAGNDILMSVHDEGIAEGTADNVDEFCEYMCMKQAWAETIPLRADGYIAKRYRKD
jgi:DNA polymerase